MQELEPKIDREKMKKIGENEDRGYENRGDNKRGVVGERGRGIGRG